MLTRTEFFGCHSLNSTQPASPDDSIALFFAALPARHRPERTRGWYTTVHFRFNDAGRPDWTLLLADAVVTVTEGHSGEPDCFVNTSVAVFLALAYDGLRPEQAFATGQVKLSRPAVMLRVLRAFDRAPL